MKLEMSDQMQKMARENGKLEYEGKTFVLLQQAYIEGSADYPNDNYYTATAVCIGDEADEDGQYDVYDIRWDIRSEFLEAMKKGDADDEGDACDWENPSNVERNGCGWDAEANCIC